MLFLRLYEDGIPHSSKRFLLDVHDEEIHHKRNNSGIHSDKPNASIHLRAELKHNMLGKLGIPSRSKTHRGQPEQRPAMFAIANLRFRCAAWNMLP
jgi:hypothetical protein